MKKMHFIQSKYKARNSWITSVEQKNTNNTPNTNTLCQSIGKKVLMCSIICYFEKLFEKFVLRTKKNDKMAAKECQVLEIYYKHLQTILTKYTHPHKHTWTYSQTQISPKN